jgi:hypothetical protein
MIVPKRFESAVRGALARDRRSGFFQKIPEARSRLMAAATWKVPILLLGVGGNSVESHCFFERFF